ncbi:MAG: choice-of-anchor D domain-containing protein [Chthoniobacterales bacterium]
MPLKLRTIFVIAALMSVATSQGQITNPDAPTVSFSRGTFANGDPVFLAGSRSNPPTLFTWLETPVVSGKKWAPNEAITIHLFGPLNSPLVAPSDTVLPTFFPPGQLVADGSGNFSRVTTTPDRLPPGYYQVHAIGSRLFAQFDDASTFINICPQTVPRSEDTWAKSRGGRDGQIGDLSPERIDPEWLSVWSETPVSLYGTIAQTQAMGIEAGNQASFISHEDTPNMHYAHDWNMEVLPDPKYLWVLGPANFNAGFDHANYASLECEWETQNNGRPFTGSYGHGNIGMPLWVTPTAGDKIFIVGRWNMDNGHPDTGDRTELHPVRMLAVTRRWNTVVPFSSAGGCVTRASQTDVFVSGHGGGANKFPDQLSVVLNRNGLGGGAMEDVLTQGALTAYYQFGPANSSEVDLITTLLGGDDDLIKEVAGPSALGWTAGPELRPVNDMDYDFDVPLPPRPAGATHPLVTMIQHPEHTTAVREVITYLNDPDTGLPTYAHFHLPYHGADNGIYARTFKFYWDKLSLPGRHFVVKMNNISFFLPPRMSGKAYMWADVCGQWVFLTDVDPAGFLRAKDTLTGNLQNLPAFDVYVDPTQNVRVFAQGYDQEEFDDLFGVDIGQTAYEAAVHLANATAAAKLKNPLDSEDGENEDLGGAVFERAPIPINILAGGILGHHQVSAGLFYMDFTISYVPAPHADVTATPVDFGAVPIGGSQDRVVQISNAATGLITSSGVDTLSVNNISVSGGGFSLAPGTFASTTVDAGGHQDITVRFSPNNASQGAGTLTVNTNDPCRPTRMVSLTGTVLAPQITGSSSMILFPATVIGCMSSEQFTISNTGTVDLVVRPSLTGAGYSVNPFLSSGDGIHLLPGHSTQLTFNFAPTTAGNAQPGTLTLTDNDPVHPITRVDLCGDGAAQPGVRVLVVHADGTAYPIVDQIMIKGKGIAVNQNVTNVALVGGDLTNCEPQYHYQTVLPVNEVPAGKHHRASSYQLNVKIGRQKRTFTFTVQDCQFETIVVTI